MKAITLKCKPNCHFHFGKYAPDSNAALNNSDDTFHSDSLFSALVITYNQIFSDTSAFVEQFNCGNIKISSLFYKIESHKGPVWFLPKPLSFHLFEINDYKSLKRISFISKRLYNYIQNPQELFDNKNVIILQNKFALLASELDVDEDLTSDLKIYNRVVIPKVYVNKETQGDDLYQVDVIEIADNSSIDERIRIHFYFLLETKPDFDKIFGDKLKIVIELLAQSGIGAEKGTIGALYGYSVEENWLNDINNMHDKYDLLISLSTPQDNEFKKLNLCNSMLRGGRTISRKRSNNEHERLKSIRMITEGSIVEKSLQGKIVDIEPDNWDGIPFKRNGTAFTIPIKKSWI